MRFSTRLCHRNQWLTSSTQDLNCRFGHTFNRYLSGDCNFFYFSGHLFKARAEALSQSKAFDFVHISSRSIRESFRKRRSMLYAEVLYSRFKLYVRTCRSPAHAPPNKFVSRCSTSKFETLSRPVHYGLVLLLAAEGLHHNL